MSIVFVSVSVRLDKFLGLSVKHKAVIAANT